MHEERLFSEMVGNFSVLIHDGLLKAEHRGRGIEKYFEYEENEVVDLEVFMRRCSELAETSNGYYEITVDGYDKDYTVKFYTSDGAEEGSMEGVFIGSITFRLLYFNEDIDIHQALIDNGTIDR